MTLDLGARAHVGKDPQEAKRNKASRRRKERRARLVCYTYIPSCTPSYTPSYRCGIYVRSCDLPRSTWERFVTARDSSSRYNIDFMAPSCAIPRFPRCFSAVRTDTAADAESRLELYAVDASADWKTECGMQIRFRCALCVHEVSRKRLNVLVLAAESSTFRNCIFRKSAIFLL